MRLPFLFLNFAQILFFNLSSSALAAFQYLEAAAESKHSFRFILTFFKNFFKFGLTNDEESNTAATANFAAIRSIFTSFLNFFCAFFITFFVELKDWILTVRQSLSVFSEINQIEFRAISSFLTILFGNETSALHIFFSSCLNSFFSPNLKFGYFNFSEFYTDKLRTGLGNERLKFETIDNSISFRTLKFFNPTIKYNYKSGDYFPKFSKETYNYLFSILSDLTSLTKLTP